jgi:hypothetical protein
MKKLLSTPFGKDEEVIVVPETQVEMPEFPAEPTADELGRLRDILFGSQSRTIEKRLADLEFGLQAARRELSDTFGDKLESASGTSASQLTETRTEFNRKLESLGSEQTAQLRSAQKDLAERLERQTSEQNAQLRTAQKELSDRLDRLEADFVNQLRTARKELDDQIEKMGVDQAERLRGAQTEARQRDDTLRQELLELAASLENKKTSRQDLGQMLIELGLRLRRDSDSPLP